MCLVALPFFMPLILVETNYLLKLISVFSLGTLILIKATIVLSPADILLVLLLPFFSPSYSLPHLVSVCLLISSLVIRRNVLLF